MRAFLVLLAVSVALAAVPGQEGPFFFQQRVDHFSSDPSYFTQKYYEIGSTNTGPVFLYISGEAPLSGFANDYVLKYAAEFNATLVTIEHRYYGSSLPKGDNFTVENLQLLTVEQALADLANFVSTKYPGRPLVTFGCSYAGALATWFRVAYPNVTVGTVSSSGVVNPILDFQKFDEQISISLSSNLLCLSRVKAALEAIEHQLEVDPKATMAQFKVYGWSNEVDFLLFMADSSAETVQYGYQSTLCNYMNSTNDLIAAYAKFINEFYSPTYLGGDVNSYSRESVAGLKGNAGRAWWWQKCSQLAYFQTAPDVAHSLRSQKIDLEYYRGFCEYVYGPNVWPDVSKVITKYGGVKPHGNEFIWLQSSQDPWQWAGIRAPVGTDEFEFTVECDNCGHCSDTRGCPSLPGNNPTQTGCENMDNVWKARNLTIDTIKRYIS